MKLIKSTLLAITAVFMIGGFYMGSIANPLAIAAIPGLAIYVIEGFRKEE